MAQAVAKVSFSERIKWNQRVKPALIVLVVAAIAYLVGFYMVAPRTAAQQPSFMPASFAALPAGSVLVMHEDGTSALLPVRIADTNDARAAGFKGVGEQAMENKFLFYSLARQTTVRTSYAVENVRAPVAFAAIDSGGTVVSITTSTAGATRVSIPEPHQYLLAAKAGTLQRFGVEVGSTIDPAAVRRF